jgi:hypothetical protein
MEHSKRSAELCGWAVVYDGSAEGELRYQCGILPYQNSTQMRLVNNELRRSDTTRGLRFAGFILACLTEDKFFSVICYMCP